MNDYEKDKEIIALYIRDIKNNGFDKLLTVQREKELSKIIRKGKDEDARIEAINELVSHNLRLVIKLAKGCNTQIYECRGIDFPDLISAGNLGLRRAAELYDGKYGKFVTYAYYSVQRAIWAYIDTNVFTIRVPRHHKGVIGQIYKLKAMHGQDIDTHFLSKMMGMSEKNIKRIMSAGIRCNAKSLNVNVGFDDSNFQLIDLIKDEHNQELFEEEVEFNERKNYLLEKMKKLSGREQVVLFLNFFSAEHLTLEDIGEELEITRERVRQILNTSLKKMKKIMALDNPGLLTAEQIASTSLVKRQYHSKHNKSKYIEDGVLSFEELKKIGDIIRGELLGGQPVLIHEYIQKTKKFKMLKFGWRINKVIENDIRLAAFLPKGIYKVLRSRIVENPVFTYYDYEFVDKNHQRGKAWLMRHMYCSRGILTNRMENKRLKVKQSPHIYTKAEEDFIREQSDKGIEWLAEKLDLSENAIRNKAKRMNVDMSSRGTPLITSHFGL